MKIIKQLLRLFYIAWILACCWKIKKPHWRGKRLRLALEKLGPIFVKFGQALSTRRDLLPIDIADELALLQDRVPPFKGELVRKIIKKTYGKMPEELFAFFDITPLASASIAQVHKATLFTGEEVVVKVLRPNVKKYIQRDIALLYFLAKFVKFVNKRKIRVDAKAIVAEFETTLLDELDLLREAANASQLKRNFAQQSQLLYVPKIYWDYAKHNVMVMEYIEGIAINNLEQLKECKINLKSLAERGVEIFFTQVFRDNFFHADMHPGNIFVSMYHPENPQYKIVDFGIMGTLDPKDQRYIAENFLAFFKRDYRRVALLHVESGWAPANTRIEQLESAIRTVCEPIFERPLAEISFGQLLLQLFQMAGRFNIQIQPQLILLQKTLLNVEGLARQLYPGLDLWKTAKPYLENWMRQKMGLRAFLRQVREKIAIILSSG